MAKKILREYQARAVKEVLEKIDDALSSDSRGIITLKSGTGTGKTLITASLIEEIIKARPGKKTAFFYFAPSTGALAEQGYAKINGYLKEGTVKGFSTFLFSTKNIRTVKYLQDRKVYFTGWSKLGSGDSKLWTDQSYDVNFYSTIKRTHDEGVDIIVLIDEAHLKDTKMTKEFLSIINPIVTIGMTATPKGSADVSVDNNDVIDDQAIKKFIEVNKEHIENVENIIDESVKKFDEIKVTYEHFFQKSIKPLLVVQIPDGTEKETKDEQQRVINKFESLGYIKGKNLAVWLSEEKTISDKDEITKNNSKIEVLIFKQAIAVGWDAPRACVYVKFRDIKVESFAIQSLGRIMRMPNGGGYVGHKDVDHAWVFTTDKNFQQQIDDYNDENSLVDYDIKTTKENIRIQRFVKHGDNNSNIDINKFVNLFDKTIEDKIRAKFDSIKETIPNEKIQMISQNMEQLVLDLGLGDTSDVQLSKKVQEDEVYTIGHVLAAFNKYVASSKRGDIWKTALRTIFGEDYPLALRVIFENLGLREELIYELIRTLKELNQDETLIQAEEWSVPAIARAPKISSQRNANTMWIHNVKYLDNHNWSKPEKAFLAIIAENHESIDWVYRNEVNGHSFYIPYLNEDNVYANFYPDFVIRTKSGKTIIVETKGTKLGENIDLNLDSKQEALFSRSAKIGATCVFAFWNNKRKQMTFEVNENGKKVEVNSFHELLK